ncbi:MAG: hypothetical protein J0H25_21355, partial [Rhizobiales bacterium]|nr:hypothetical protein [Hyphomicrobiales bacterium]
MTTMTPQSTSATFTVGDERQARRIVDVLEESLDPGEVAVAAFENASGVWEVVLHFPSPPDEDAIRNLVGLAGGDGAAAALSFQTIEAKDWVKASLEGLVPVQISQMDISATPSTLNNCGLTIHRAVSCRSMSDREEEERPIVRITLVDVVSGSSLGACTPAGSPAAAAL